MADPNIVPQKEENKDNNVPVLDVFGSDNGQSAPKDEPKEEPKGEDKKFETIPDDHPTIIALNKKIEEVKAEYGSNLSGQRDVIKKLENEIKEFKASNVQKKEEQQANLPFDPKEIIYTKDLPKEQREDMTPNEIKIHDELMKTRETVNKQAIDEHNRKLADSKKSEEVTKVADLNMSVRTFADELAEGDKDLANQIIESTKMFQLDGLSAEDLKSRVVAAAKLVPNYKPKTETVQKRGAPIKETIDDKDPFGTERVIDSVVNKRNGSTFKL